jgi:hypothetical protein
MPELDTATLDQFGSLFFRERKQTLSQLAEPYTIDDLIRAFQNLRRGMARLLNGLTEAQVCFNPDDSTYSISEIVTHLIAAQGITYNAFLDIVDSTRPHVDPVPRTAGGGAERGISAHILQHRLDKATGDFIQVLRETYEQKPEKEVENPFIGKLSYKGWLLFQLLHDLDHLKQAQILRRSPSIRARHGY